jgi:catechol 2,3-dioxygenase-like lactoylglutathione lyase family enzyme
VSYSDGQMLLTGRYTEPLLRQPLTLLYPPTARERCLAGANVGESRREAQMTKPEISGIAPFFIVKNVPSALSFYRDRLGFKVTFQGPEPDNIFFGIVQRGAAMIMFKDVGVNPVPNYTRDVKKGIARWDVYLHVPDPDALAAELSSRNVDFSEPLKDTDDGLRGFELKDADGYVLFFGRPRS